MMDRNPPDPNREAGIKEIAMKVLAAKLKGTGINTPEESLDRAYLLLSVTKVAYLDLIASIEKGLLGEPTPEDLQKCHELKALLEVLP